MLEFGCVFCDCLYVSMCVVCGHTQTVAHLLPPSQWDNEVCTCQLSGTPIKNTSSSSWSHFYTLLKARVPSRFMRWNIIRMSSRGATSIKLKGCSKCGSDRWEATWVVFHTWLTIQFTRFSKVTHPFNTGTHKRISTWLASQVPDTEHHNNHFLLEGSQLLLSTHSATGSPSSQKKWSISNSISASFIQDITSVMAAPRCEQRSEETWVRFIED